MVHDVEITLIPLFGTSGQVKATSVVLIASSVTSPRIGSVRIFGGPLEKNEKGQEKSVRRGRCMDHSFQIKIGERR